MKNYYYNLIAMKEILASGLLGGVLMLAIGMAVGQLFQALVSSLKTEYEKINLFRPWSDPLLMLFFVHPFLLGLGLVWVWGKTKSVLTADTDFKKGLTFSLLFWGVATKPGMLISYVSFPLSLMMIISWTTGSLIQLLNLGVLFSKTLK